MKRNRRAGYFLIEVLANVVILAIILNLAAQVLLTCMRLSAFGVSTADGMVHGQRFEDAFRGAVREAFAVVPAVGAYQTDADTLVLETPSPEGRRFTVVGRLGDADKFAVLKVIESNGILEPEAMHAFPVRKTSMEFAYDAPDAAAARLVTMKLAAKGRETQIFSAAMRGRNRL